MDATDAINWAPILWAVGSVVGVILLWTLVGYPHWRVWASHQRGLADLQIQIAKAQSRKIEAEAVAEQIKAIGTQLTAHDLYLRWQWIKMMEDTHSESENSVIYVPTEANIPILEANRLRNTTEKSEDES